MRRLATALLVALFIAAAGPRANATEPTEITYPPQPGDKCPAGPDADTPTPGSLDPRDAGGDTPWRYCLEEKEGPVRCYCWCDGPRPAHAPEPGTLALLALGAVGLVVARRHSR